MNRLAQTWADASRAEKESRQRQGAAPLRVLRLGPAEPYSHTPRTQKRGSYSTWARMALLSAVEERPGGLLVDLAPMAELSERRAADGLRWMKQSGFVYAERTSRGLAWHLTTTGLNLLDRARLRLRGTFSPPVEDPRTNKPIPPDRSVRTLLFLAARRISAELRRLGWYPGAISLVFKLHHVSHILRLLRSPWLRRVARNFGALLYTILMKGEAILDSRFAGLARVMGEGLSSLRSAFVAIAKNHEMSFSEARHLACAVRKRSRKGFQVTVGDIQGIAGWVLKSVRC